jgi:hypothetical protein
VQNSSSSMTELEATVHDWEEWLQTWNRKLLARYDPTKYNAFVDPLVTPEIVASGWLGSPGASEAQIAGLETRLGTTLPPSYRSFLRVSNGFLQPGVIVPRLLPIEEVAWLRDVDSETIEIWTEGLSGSPESNADVPERRLSAALRISARETVGSAIYLLDPQSVNAEGEWEAWYFAHWVPGVDRFPSFRALMQSELDKLLAPPPPPPPGRAKTFVDVVRWIFRPES